MVFVPAAVGDPEGLGNERDVAVQRHRLSVAKHEMHFWASRRLARDKLAGDWQAAEDDPTLLGLSAATGGPPDCRIRCAWSAFCAETAR